MRCKLQSKAQQCATRDTIFVNVELLCANTLLNKFVQYGGQHYIHG